MLDTLRDQNKNLYYPYLKDSIDAIRKKAYADQKVDAINKIDRIDGVRLYYAHNYSTAIPLLVKVIHTDRTLRDLDSLQVYYCLKNCYLRIKSISKALDVDKTLESFKKRNKTYSRWFFNPTLSTIYYEIGIYDEAIRQHRLEFNESTDRSDPTLLSYHNNEGVFWSRLNMADSALFHFQLAREYAEKLYHNSTKAGEKFSEGLIDGNIGQVYKLQKKYKEAIPLLQKDIYWSLASHNVDNAAISYNELAECHICMGNYGLAQKYLDSAKAIVTKYQDIAPRQVNMKLYALLYEKSGNYPEALKCYKRYLESTDSLDLTEKQKELISQQVALQMDEKERIIKQKQRIIEQEEESKKRQGIIRTMLFAGLLFLLFTLLVVLTLYKRSNKQKTLLEIKNEEIRRQNAKIERSLQEKDFLVREVHHRVKNNLQIVSSLLNLQINKTQNEEIREALAEARQRIVSIAFVHRLLYRNKELTIIPVKEYFESLLQQLSETFSDKHSEIVMNKDIADISMDLDRSIPVGLIINEIVSNAYKHAFPNRKGMINISFKEINGLYELRISDNGVGFAGDADIENADSFGLEIIKILTEQINGKMLFENTQGVSFTITFN